MIKQYTHKLGHEPNRAKVEVDKNHDHMRHREKYKLKLAMVKEFKKEFKSKWQRGGVAKQNHGSL